MPKNVPDEVVVARLSIEAARTALESLFERISAAPRAEKVIVSEMVTRSAHAQLRLVPCR
jgi:hypothetical protein